MNNFLIKLTIAMTLLLPGIASAVPITIVSQQDNWEYNLGAGLGATNFNSTLFSDFTAGFSGGMFGDAAFGNGGGGGGVPLFNTYWIANTALYLQKTVNLSGAINGDVLLNVAVDNGAVVFVNGTKVFNADAGGFTSFWEYSQNVSGSLFIDGLNTISVIANDYGGATYFDMQLVGDIGPSAVPVPASITLLLLGLTGLGLHRGAVRRGKIPG